jgi:hypothetical protein
MTTDTIHESVAHDDDGVILEPAIEVADEVKLPSIEGELATYLPADKAQRMMAYVPQIKAREFLPVPMADIRDMADLLKEMPGIAEEFRGNLGATAAVIMQAVDWKVSPPFLLRNAYQAKKGGQIGYEAKALNAVIIMNAPLRQRPRYRFGYGGDGSPTVGNRFVVVDYDIIGSDKIQSLRSPTVSQIKTKNSPEWFSHTDKQLIYYIGRAGANALFPDVLGGAYSREEVAYMAAMERAEGIRERLKFDDDDEGAEFEDGIAPTDQDAKNFARAQAKADGQQDSRDPRDAPQNRPQQQKGPTPPPQGAQEPDDMPALREWLMSEQKRLLALPDGPSISAGWSELIKDDRIGRIKAYAQPVFNAVKASISAKVAELKTAG